jgi:hypothetical protein
MMLTNTTKGRGYAPRLRAVLFGAALLLPAVGCGDILEVDDPDVTNRDLLTTPEAVPALRAGALGDFTTGYEQLINLGGMLGDEFFFSETFPTRIVVDQRNIHPNNSNLLTLFAQVATANAAPEFSARRIAEIQAAFPDVTGLNDERAEGLNLSSIAKVLIAEHYCEGIPLSRLEIQGQSLDFQYGNPLTRAQMLDSAIAGFDKARTAVGASTAAADAAQRNLAIVGRARAMLNRASSQAEIAALLPFLTANPVPLTYTFQLQHSTNSGGENNQVWNFNTLNERISVANLEGTNGLPYRAVRAGQPGGRDPRVLWIRTPANDVGFDGTTLQFDALKYPDRPAFTVIASGVEARLMVAEAQLNAGNAQAMLDSLNSLRTQVQPLMQLLNFDYVTQQQKVGYAPGQSATLAPLVLPATFAEQRDLLMAERAYWLVFSAHRLGDMRRLIRQYGLTQAQVFPTGAYHKGGVYGTDVNFPIPIQEANNPNAPETPDAQCINRNA